MLVYTVVGPPLGSGLLWSYRIQGTKFEVPCRIWPPSLPGWSGHTMIRGVVCPQRYVRPKNYTQWWDLAVAPEFRISSLHRVPAGSYTAILERKIPPCSLGILLISYKADTEMLMRGALGMVDITTGFPAKPTKTYISLRKPISSSSDILETAPLYCHIGRVRDIMLQRACCRLYYCIFWKICVGENPTKAYISVLQNLYRACFDFQNLYLEEEALGNRTICCVVFTTAQALAAICTVKAGTFLCLHNLQKTHSKC